MNRAERANKYVGRCAELLTAILVVWSIIDYLNGANKLTILWSGVVFAITALSIEICLRNSKALNSKWLRYFACCLYGLSYCGVFFFTKYPVLLASSFISCSIIIIFHDLKYMFFLYRSNDKLYICY